MSPEQALGAPLDGRSDLFGLGVVLWEALAGQRLFKTDSGLLTLERVRDAVVPSLPEGRVPKAVQAIVRMALARDPEDRFADAGDATRLGRLCRRPRASAGAPRGLGRGGLGRRAR